MKKPILLTSIVWTLTAGGQLVAAWILYDPGANSTRINIGWLILFISGIFGWLPIFTFRSRGKVAGRSYVHTTVVVDSGIYSIVRHPQYLAGLLINLAVPLITWHWLVIILGAASIVMYWWSAVVEEEINLDKFGDAYREYQERVPRFNFLRGLYRKLNASLSTNQENKK